MSSAEAVSPQARWWGEFTLAANTMGRWQVGPLQLWVQRLAGEWRVAWRADEVLMQPVAEVALSLPIEPPHPDMRELAVPVPSARGGESDEKGGRSA